MVTATQTMHSRDQTVQRHAAHMQRAYICSSHSRGLTSSHLSASCMMAARRASVGSIERRGGEDSGRRASSSSGYRLADRCTHAVRSCQSIGGGPDERSSRGAFVHPVSAPLARPGALPTAGRSVDGAEGARTYIPGVGKRGYRPLSSPPRRSMEPTEALLAAIIHDAER